MSSAAMAAAVVAAHGSNWKPVNSNHSSSNPPYSPRSNLLSPVKFGDQLKELRTSSAKSTYADYRLPSYTKDSLAEKLRQEAWVTRRIQDLTREGLWSGKNSKNSRFQKLAKTYCDFINLISESLKCQKSIISKIRNFNNP